VNSAGHLRPACAFSRARSTTSPASIFLTALHWVLSLSLSVRYDRWNSNVVEQVRATGVSVFLPLPIPLRTTTPAHLPVQVRVSGDTMPVPLAGRI